MVKMMTRECGACSMCCKLPSIAPLNKPVDHWCQHCNPKAAAPCTIYSTRPQVCVDFKCEWLQHPDIPEVWYPAESKMVLNVGPASGKFRFMNVMVDVGSPNRWREQPYHSLLRQMALVGMHPSHRVLVRVTSGQRSFLVLPLEDVEIPEGTASMDVSMSADGNWRFKFK